jgi:transglutaminase-like putative cysteine protease
MKTPPLLLFATLLFWGWQSGLPLVGALAGAVLEATLFLRWRWDLEDVDFNRIWSFCILVMVALAGYVLTTSNEGGGPSSFVHNASVRNASVASVLTATTMLRWLPLTCFPLIAAQVYNVRPSVPLTAISLVLRWRRRRGEHAFEGRYLNVSYPYFMVTVFAAGIHANHEEHTYFWGQSVLILWALWALRSRRFGLRDWALALAAVVALGFLGQLGISQAERMAQNLTARWMARFLQSKTDAAQSMTSMGQLGEMKLSPRIVIRLEPEKVGQAPTYLREASYRSYSPRNQTWYAGGALNDFNAVHQEPDDTTWVLLPGKAGNASVNIACYLNGRSADGDPEGLLPLPSGCCRLEHLPAVSSVIALQTNKTGAVLATGSGLMIFDARYGPGATLDTPPDLNSTNHFDLTVPTNEFPALAQVIAEMNLTNANDLQKRLAVESFFLSKFTYSRWQGPDKRATNATPLTRFLLNSRSGHCEYFATATVLLLRQLGIPARYAVGYAVHETSGSGYVVRERDSHAWCLAWNREKKIWEDFDTTPGSWLAIEGGHSAFTDWISDVRSWVGFQFSKLRWRQAHLRQYILWTLVPVMAVLVYYIIFQRRTKKQPPQSNVAAGAAVVWPGHDSAFYRLEKILATLGLSRAPGETLADWLERLLAEPAVGSQRGPLQELLRLHYRYRFDPSGLDEREKQLLAQNVDSVLAALARK